MRLVPIASGSSGNCIYVGSESTHLLVDAGISAKRIVEGINSLELNTDDIDGLLITHEHVDHIGGLGVICRKYNIPVYGTEKTIDAIKNYDKLGPVENDVFHCIIPDESFILKDIKVNSFRTSHDCADPVAYTFENGNKKVAIATDLGTYSDYTIDNLQNLDALLLEANHDIRMLQVGPYPYWLKQRILSDEGHLSNENAGKLLSRILNDNIKRVFLGHLSKENNMPELAYEAVRVEIELADNEYHANDFDICVARRDCVSPVIVV